MPIILTKQGDELRDTDVVYRGADGSTIRREFAGETENGNPFGGRWVLRDAGGKFVDVDQYRHDLFARRNFHLKD